MPTQNEPTGTPADDVDPADLDPNEPGITQAEKQRREEAKRQRDQQS
jgi:hypothetical protein